MEEDLSQFHFDMHIIKSILKYQSQRQIFNLLEYKSTFTFLILIYNLEWAI
jgi:hypothetical protein